MSSYYTYTIERSTFEPKRPKLFKLLHLDENYDEVDWNAVIHRLQTHPREASWFVPSGNLSTLRRGGYYADFLEELKNEEEEAYVDTIVRSEEDNTLETSEDSDEKKDMKPPVVEGWTALHTACYLDPPPRAIKALIDAFPEATGMKSATGYTPLHFCSFSELAPNVAKIIIEASPAWVLSSKNSLGETPLDRLSKQWEEGAQLRNGAFSFDYIGSTKSLEVDDDEAKILDREMSPLWKKIDMLLRASAFTHLLKSQYDKLIVISKQSLPYNPLHIAAYLGCSPAVLKYAYLLDKRQTRLLSQKIFNKTYGQHPLALVASSPHILEKQKTKEIIMALLKMDPSLSSIPDEEGRLPLHIAIENGITWSQGVENLLRSSPQALNTRDVKTLLYPFQLAAIGENSCLTTLYLLLRNDPENARGLADPPPWVRRKMKFDQKLNEERNFLKEKLEILQKTIVNCESEIDQLQSDLFVTKCVNEELRTENESLRLLVKKLNKIYPEEERHDLASKKRPPHK